MIGSSPHGTPAVPQAELYRVQLLPAFGVDFPVERVMTFSIVNRGQGWFWCSYSLLERHALIGPFPSQEEAEKDARATLGIEKWTG